MATIKKPEIKIPSVKLPEINLPELNADLSKAAKDVAAVAKDATYVVIGAGVLGYQQAQVQRHELMKRLAEPRADIEQRVNSARTDLSGALHSVDATVESVMERFEEIIERLETAIAPLEDHLPAQARDLAKQAHVQAKEARVQLRSKIPTTAA
jgi:exonuclease VII small subunit